VLDRKTTSRAFVCSNEGFRRKDKRDDQVKYPRDETRTGCHVRLVVKLIRKSNKYEIIDFINEHNHMLQLPQSSYLMPCQRKVSYIFKKMLKYKNIYGWNTKLMNMQVTDVAAFNIDLTDNSRIQPKAAREFMSLQAGGVECIGHTLTDHNNYLRDKRKRTLIHGEAISILRYFCQQAIDNPFFQHDEQVDDQNEIRNIYWADAQMVIDYAQFGDVVIFDTTHGTNKEYRPFGVFVGFNHFRKTIIFGAILLYDQSIESFQWVFHTFLKSHNNKKPKTIFTDQDAAMGIAIANMMPDVSHGLCTWHISENATKHLISHNDDEMDCVAEFRTCIFGYEDEGEFENAFSTIQRKVGGTWLPFVYKERKKWAYCYMKDVFSLGIRSTQLSESLNKDLKNYLKSDLDIVRFFNHFERVVADKREKEVISEYECRKKVSRIKVNVLILLQMSKRYTPKIFELFQEEYELSMAAQIQGPIANEYIVRIYNMGDIDPSSKGYRVFWNPIDQIISCSCRKFENIYRR
jgi:zinc finger SWIM domain-containing protein 3